MDNSKRVYNLQNINELQLFPEEIEVVDHETGEEKIIKTVSRADNAVIVAYLLGVPDDVLESYYDYNYGEVLKSLKNNKEATIIRYLSEMRTILFKNFLNIDNEIRFNLSNLDRMDYFDKSKINKLFSWGIYVVQPNYRADMYSERFAELIDKNIDACKKLFAETVKFEYIRELFVPNYRKKGVLKEEYDKYHANKSLYPFQCYMNWEPVENGNILYSDGKFFSILYAQHKEEFYDYYKYRDVTEDTKKSIYDFVESAQRIVMVVDCENVDPYKLYGVLKNLDQENMSHISKIVLYDDYHTTVAWDYLANLIHIDVEHIEVDRVTDAKSLVDIEMSVGVAKAFFRDAVDSFILCSSDSDFWGLISQIPEAKFLVLYEYNKCGQAIKDALAHRGIYSCCMDDFYKQNAQDLQTIVLKRILREYVPRLIGENAWELTKQIYAEAYVQASESEMKMFYDRFIKTLKLSINQTGEFEIIVQ